MLARIVEPMAKGQAERLAPLIAEVLAQAGLAPRDLAAVAVCTGPGNFTGVRIGVAAARGLALAIGRPGYGVPRLQALAEAAADASGARGLLLSLAAARRDERHAQVFDLDVAGAALAAGEAAQLPEAELASRFAPDAPAFVAGPGAGTLAAALGVQGLRTSALGEGDLVDPAYVARIAARELAALPPGVRPPRPAPIYPRPPEADPPSDVPPPLIADAPR